MPAHRGRAADLELLIVERNVSALIRDGKTHQVPSAMQVGRGVGMAVLCTGIVLALQQPRCPACRNKLGSLSVVTPDGKLVGLPAGLSACPDCGLDLDERSGHDGLVEILSVFEKSGVFYGAVGVPVRGETLRYELSLGSGAHRDMEKIIQMQPFGKQSGSGYRYFLVPEKKRAGHTDASRVTVRIEDGTREQDARATLPSAVLTLLDYLQSLDDPRQVMGLKFAGAVS